MRAALDDAALLENHDAVGVAHGTQPVGDDEAGAPLHQGVHAALDEHLGAGVNGARGFVENQHRGIGDRRAGDGQQLPLALREVAAVAGEHGVVAILEAADEAVGIGELCRADALGVRGVEPAVADVLHDRAGEEVRILQHHAERPAQIALADLVDVDVVIADLAVLNVIEAVDEVRDRRLAGAGAADEGDLLPGLGIHLDVVQDGLFRRIAEVHPVEGDAALELAVGDGAVGLMRVLPRPDAGLLGRLGEGAVGVLDGVDELDVALVCLGRLIHDVEHALGARRRHDDAVELLAHAHHGLRKTLAQREEAHERADGEAGVPVEGEDRAENGAEDVAEVSEVAVDGHEHARDAVGVVGAVTELIVELFEVRDGLLLVAEDLDDLLAGDHLLDIAVDGAEIVLLPFKIFAGALRHQHTHAEHEKDHQQAHDRERNVQHDHGDEAADEGDRGRDELRDRLADDLAQGVHVVGIDGHDIAVGMRVEKGDRQLLHAGEELDAQALHRALAHRDHDAIIDIAREGAEQKHAHEHKHDAGQRAVVRHGRLRERNDVIINQRAHGERADERDERGEDDADNHDGVMDLIVLHHIGDDAL